MNKKLSGAYFCVYPKFHSGNIIKKRVREGGGWKKGRKGKLAVSRGFPHRTVDSNLLHTMVANSKITLLNTGLYPYFFEKFNY